MFVECPDPTNPFTRPPFYTRHVVQFVPPPDDRPPAIKLTIEIEKHSLSDHTYQYIALIREDGQPDVTIPGVPFDDQECTGERHLAHVTNFTGEHITRRFYKHSEWLQPHHH